MQIANDDEPGSPLTFEQRHRHLQTLVGALVHGADGRPMACEILREIERLHPGAIDREHARMLARRLNLTPIPSRIDLLAL